MAGEWPRIVTGKSSDCIRDIWLSCKCCVHYWSHDCWIASDIFQFYLPPIIAQVRLYIRIHGSRDSVNMLRAESLENSGDIGFRTETNSGTNFIAVDLCAKELVCRAEIGNLIFLWQFCLDIDGSLGGGLRILHREIVNIQKYQNAITAEIEVGISWRLGEPYRK